MRACERRPARGTTIATRVECDSTVPLAADPASLYNRSSIPPWPSPSSSPARRLFAGRLAALALALVAAPRAGARAAGRAGAARRRRLDLRRLRPPAGRRLGRPARGAPHARNGYPLPRRQREHHRRHHGRRPRAPAGAARARTSRPSSSSSSAATTGCAAATSRPRARISPRWSPPSQSAGAKALHRRHAGCRRITAPRTSREFDALFAERREGAQGAARPVLLRGLRRAQRHCSSPTASIRRPRRSRCSSTTSGRRCCRSWDRGDESTPPRARPRPQGDHRRARRLSPSASTCAARPSSPTTTCRARRAIRCSTTPSARASARCTRRNRRSPPGAPGAALVARNIAAMLETSFAGEAARLGAARLLLARRPAQPLARARAERDRLARRAARRRLSRLPAARRRAARERCPARFRYEVVCGLTGSGKSRLHRRARRARARRCSTSKRWRGIAARCWATCPTTRSRRRSRSTAQLLAALAAFDPARPVYVESESKKIGTVQVPDALLAAMRAADVHPPRHCRSRCGSSC